MLNSKMLRKVLILSCLIIGLIIASGGRSQAAFAALDNCQEQNDCLNQAGIDYNNCETECPPFASCYYQCYVRYEAAQNACYSSYPCP